MTLVGVELGVTLDEDLRRVHQQPVPSVSCVPLQMNNAEPSPIDRRRRVGWSAIICLVVAALGYALSEADPVWPAAALRVGIVLGALWLCFPTKTRPAAWAALTNGRMAILIIGALLWNRLMRLKFAMPYLALASIFIWFIRPRKK